MRCCRLAAQGHKWRLEGLQKSWVAKNTPATTWERESTMKILDTTPISELRSLVMQSPLDGAGGMVALLQACQSFLYTPRGIQVRSELMINIIVKLYSEF
jgi:hypothetical protein